MIFFKALIGFWVMGFTTRRGETATIAVPDVGLVIENTEIAVHTLQDVYHTLVYHVGLGDNNTFSSECGWVAKGVNHNEVIAPLWNLVNGYQRVALTSVCDASPLLCDQSWADRPQTRPKRFVGMLGVMAGFAGVGLAMKNRVRLEQLDNAISTVYQNQGKIRDFIEEKSRNTTAELHKLENLILSQSAHLRLTVDRLNSRVCAMETHYANAFLTLSNRLLLDEAYDIVEKAQRGDLDPRLVPLPLIAEMTSPGGTLVNTVYEADPDLFYALTTPYLVAADRTKGTITYILQTPQIQPADISPVYSIYNHGFYDTVTKKWLTVQVPPRFFTLVDRNHDAVRRIPIPLDNARCFPKGNMLICRHEIPEITNASLCLHNLLELRSTERCTLSEATTNHGTIVQVTHSAVMLRGITSYATTQTIRGIPKTQTHNLDKDVLTVIPHTEYTTLQADGHTIVSALVWN